MSRSRDCSTGLDSTIREYLYIGRISFCYGAEATSIHSDHALPPIQLTSKQVHAQKFSCSGVASHAAMIFLLKNSLCSIFLWDVVVLDNLKTREE